MSFLTRPASTTFGLLNGALDLGRVALWANEIEAQAVKAPLAATDKAEIATLTYSDVEVGQIVTDVSTGDTYVVAPQAAAVVDYAPGVVNFLVRDNPDGHFHPRQFGWTGDGTAQNEAAMRLANFCRRRKSAVVNFDPDSVYAYTNNILFAGVENKLVLNLNGSALQNLYVTVNGANPANAPNECLIFPDPLNSNENDRSNNENVFDHGPRLTANVGVGDTIIPIESGRASEFTIGKRAFLYGWYRQNSGYPNPSAAMSYATVQDIQGDNIIIHGGLSQEFRTDWPAHSNGDWGPARIVSLHRPGKFVQCAHLEVNNAVFKADPAWNNFRSGRVWFGGYRRCILRNCVGESGMYVNWGEDFEDYGSSFHDNVEIDKNSNSASFFGVDYAGCSGGTGVISIFFDHASKVRQMASLSSNERCVIDGDVTGAGEGNNPAILGTWGNGKSVVRGRLQTFDSNTSIMANPTWTTTLTYDGPITSTTMHRYSIPLTTWQTLNFIRGFRDERTVLFDANGFPIFETAYRPRQSGTDVHLDGWVLNGVAPATQEMGVAGTTHIDYTDVKIAGGNRKILNPSNTSFSGHERIIAKAHHITENSFIWPNDGYEDIPSTIETRHRGAPMTIEKITVGVTVPYTGAGNGRVRFYGVDANGSQDELCIVNTEIVGTRVFSLMGTGGLQTDDSLTSIPTKSYSRFAFRAVGDGSITDSVQSPRWTFEVTGSPVGPLY